MTQQERKEKYICVFLSANEVPQIYQDDALKLVDLLVKEHFAFVYGGSEKGLMKVAADRVKELGGKIISVVSEEFRQAWRKEVDEQIECANIPDRKKKILEVSDAIVVLPGGTGTLDEFTEILEVKKWGAHNKPVVLLNTNNYWEGLIIQYDRMRQDGFLKEPITDLVYITTEPSKAVDYINEKLSNINY